MNFAYLAGVIDGDGCLYLEMRDGRASARVEVSSSDKRYLEQIIQHFGCGTIRLGTTFLWKVYDRVAEPILQGILPYLVLKRQQAELLLEVRANTQKNNNKRTQERADWMAQAHRRSKEMHAQPLPPTLPFTTEWLAGFFDTDGSVGAYGPQQQPRLTLANTNIEALHAIRETLGRGNVYTHTYENPNHKPIGRWTVYSEDFIAVAKEILPYVVLKKERLAAALAVACE